MAKKCKTGSKFCKLENKFAAEGKRSPGGLAAYIGNKKYGKSTMQAKSRAAR